MTRDELKAALATVETELRTQFPTAVARLEQATSHLATVAMVVDHIFDEDIRHQEGN